MDLQEIVHALNVVSRDKVRLSSLLVCLKARERAIASSSYASENEFGFCGNQQEVDEVDNFSEELAEIYGRSVARILKVANKLCLGVLDDDFPYKTEIEQRSATKPDDELNKFIIGDRIVVKRVMPDFKFIQNRVVKDLRGKRGVVTMRSSDDVVVQVYFPEVFGRFSLHRAVLTRDVDEHDSRKCVACRFKVGDFVRTISLSRVVRLLMRKLPDLPEKYIGKTGQVVAITSMGIFVSYDKLASYCIDAALLQKSPVEKYSVEIIRKQHFGKFRIGEKVKVMRNLKNFIENQKGHGGFDKRMCVIAGAEGYITDIKDDGLVDVTTGCGRSWTVSNESIMKIEDNELDTTAGKTDLEFLPGDVVKVKMILDIREYLHRKSIPQIFLDYLMNTATIDSVDDNFDPWVRFNSSSKTCIKTSRLEKASEMEKARYEKIHRKLLDLKSGDDVCLDVGPPNFVRLILAEHYVCGVDIFSVLTRISKVVGWIDQKHPVIRSCCGKLYKINRKYLTLPERFELHQFPEIGDLSWDAVTRLRQNVYDSVKAVRAEIAKDQIDEFAVEIFSMIKENIPKIEFHIKSFQAEQKLDQICEELSRIYGWSIEKQYPHVYKVKASKVVTCTLIVGFLFNEDIHFSHHLSAHLSSKYAIIKKSSSNERAIGVSGQNFQTNSAIQDIKNFHFSPLTYRVQGSEFRDQGRRKELRRLGLPEDVTNSSIKDVILYTNRVTFRLSAPRSELDN